jgi:tRNA C32,U32 (ribose-2'-O)-methylase TrmJ
VWLINANDKQVKKQKAGGKKITKNCAVWLSVRNFASIAECVAALQEIECTIWATDLSPEAVALTVNAKPSALPDKLAIVIGREIDGVSAEMLAAAHQRVYFPIFGFTESLNLSVATALVVQRIFDWFPNIRGDLSDREKRDIREQWYPHLVRNPTQAAQAAPWLEDTGTNAIRPLDDLRRDKLGENERWVPKSVKRREQDMPEVQERSGKRREVRDVSGEAQE